MDKDAKDDLFSRHRDAGAGFRFDNAVARVFPDMVRRSVPCYPQLVELTGLLGERFIRPGTRCYDLGCSLGAVTLSIMERVPEPTCQFVAVDNSPAMVAALAGRLRGTPARERVNAVCADLSSVRIENASLVVLNLTLQFIRPDRRLGLLSDIRRALVPGGALILSEKIRAADPEADRLLTVLHEDYKRARGYSELEISRKRAALDQVLIPDDLELHQERLHRAGFRRSLRWFQCLNFVSFLAWT
ncbi:MAG: carboxy-S-adenosyl-L-methionine synthase CmoA [Pseudomonadota bacterium]|nr:carboxy-S-adenosyl-L-methionine synthase CmoA [Pseudomonadota bacterium]